jgi:hypothetical protein
MFGTFSRAVILPACTERSERALTKEGSGPRAFAFPAVLAGSVILSGLPRFFSSRSFCAARDAVEGPLFEVKPCLHGYFAAPWLKRSFHRICRSMPSQTTASRS